MAPTRPTPGSVRTATKSFSAPGTVSFGLEVDYPSGFATARLVRPIVIAPASSAPAGSALVAGPTFSLTRVRLAKLIKTGLPLVVTRAAPCSVKFTLSVDCRTAKKLRLKARRGKRTTIGRLTGAYAVGTTRASLKLTAAAKRRLKQARSLKARFDGVIAQGKSAPLIIAKPLTFRR